MAPKVNPVIEFWKGFGGFWNWVGAAYARAQEVASQPLSLTNAGDVLLWAYRSLVYIVEGRDDVLSGTK